VGCYTRRTLERLFTSLAAAVDRAIGWPKLPLPLGALVLIAMRRRLRHENLFDTSESEGRGAQASVGPWSVRTADGSFNDVAHPDMGRAGSRFGRNVPLADTYPDPRLLWPNPRLVSRELLARDTFKPATSLNLLAAAWLQFMIHDWLSHGRNEKDNPWQVPLPPGDDWPEDPMRILRTRLDATPASGGRVAPPNGPPTYVNTATHWWDASQLYGSDAQTLARLRSGERGKLTLTPEGLLPLDARGIDQTGVSGNWWIGLSLMHNLFSREHNAICQRLANEHPTWSDDQLFDTARLINAALLAKIHTLEWTPAIVAHPTVRFAMRTNWRTILGSRTNHHGVPYSITEEFVAVYRMHPLLPDELSFRSAADDRSLLEVSFAEAAFGNARPVLDRVGFENALYSFGTRHPGAITLHNFPRALQRLTDLDGILNYVAAIDLLRIRERGVPRYNDFRALLHKPRLLSFSQLSDKPEWVEELRHIYDGDLDAVDLMVGLYAEPLPPGFGFSETAFRLFVLMASRRLESDRFFTTDFTPAIYTQTGMDWIANNTFTSVLQRHAAGLGSLLQGIDNAFAPWPRARS
jgi:heme peroxidase